MKPACKTNKQSLRKVVISKTHFASHFNSDHSKLKIPTTISLVYTRSLQSMSPNLNNNKPSGKEIRKATKQLKNYKPSVDIEADRLKFGKNTSFFNFMKEVFYQKCIHRKWCITYINAERKQKGGLQIPLWYGGIISGAFWCKYQLIAY